MNRTKTFIADDTQEILEVIKIAFGEDPKFDFKYFNGGHFLEELHEDLDLIVVDVHMPHFDIVEAVSTIKHISKKAYIIVLSADRRFDTMKQLANLQIFWYCEKGGNFLTELKEAMDAAHVKVMVRKDLLRKFDDSGC